MLFLDLLTLRTPWQTLGTYDKLWKSLSKLTRLSVRLLLRQLPVRN
jgi:hypothetical protein